MSEAGLGTQLGVGLASIALVAGCATGPGQTPTGISTSTVMPAAILAPTVAPVPMPGGGPVMPGLVADGSLHDAVGDLVNSEGTPVNTPDYLDIRDLEAVADGTTLRLTLTLVGELPPPPLAIERLNYNISLRTNGDVEVGADGAGGGHSYTVTLSKPTPSGSYEPTLWDLPADAGTNAIRYQGREFPGTAVVAGDTIVWTVGLAALGNPHVIRLGVGTASTVNTGSDDKVSTTDQLPEGGLVDLLTLGS